MAQFTEGTPRDLHEKTGEHFCIRCLKKISSEEYLRNDFECDSCINEPEYPLASTPEAKPDVNPRAPLPKREGSSG